MYTKLNIYILYWYFQQSQCLNLRKTYSTQHTQISIGPYARAPWAKFCPACPCVKTALNTHLSYIPPMLMLKIYRPRWTQCDDNTLRSHGEVSVDACAFCINVYYICTRYKVVPKLEKVKQLKHLVLQFLRKRLNINMKSYE